MNIVAQFVHPLLCKQIEMRCFSHGVLEIRKKWVEIRMRGRKYEMGEGRGSNNATARNMKMQAEMKEHSNPQSHWTAG